MTCSKQMRAQIASRDGEKMSLVQQWKLRLHCRTCEVCRTERARMLQMETGLQGLAEALTPPHVYAALLAQLPELSGIDLPTSIHEDVVLDRNGNVRKRQLRRRWAVAASALLVVGASSITIVPKLRYTTLMLLSQYWLEQNRDKAIQKFMNASIRDSDKYNAGQLGRAKELRALWKPWAMQHKQELELMLGSDAQNETVLRWVLCTLPVLPPEKGAGITRLALYSGKRPFTWSPQGRANGGTPYHLREDFARFHDVVLSRSASLSNVNYDLWVSGRITAETYIQQHSFVDPGQLPSPLMCEVVPPYEELTQNPGRH